MILNRTCTTLLLCLGLATAAAADKLVVVDSQGSPLEPGDVVESDAALRLDAGSSLTLMRGSGEMISLTGPFEGPPATADTAGADADAGLVATVSSLLQPDKTTAAAGAFRSGAGGAAPAPQIWLIDPAAGGRHCLPAAATASLWRADASEEAVLEIFGEDGEETVWWDEEEAVADWPDSLPLAEGATYELGWEESLDASEITLRLVPETTRTDAAGLAVLIDSGCRRQAAALLAQLAAAARADG